MVEKGIYDLAADEIVKRYGLVKEEIIRRNKGKRPFRMEPVSTEEQLLQFSDYTPEIEMQDRQDFGDSPVDNYKQKMKELLTRRQSNAR